MSLNNEKLQIMAMMATLRRRVSRRKERMAEAKRSRKIMETAGVRLEQWVADKRYRLEYESLDDILEELGLTSDELRAFCVGKFGKSFLSWRKDLRMEDAKEMLLDQPDTPAYKIGRALGVNDSSNFRHQFKGSTGLTPSEWREKFSRKNLRE